MSAKGRKSDRRLRLRLLLRQSGRCFYCQATLQFKFATKDHLIPKSHEKGLRKNVVMSCRRCNEEKGNRLPTPEETKRAAELYRKKK